MQKTFIPIILFVLLVLEGVAIDFIPHSIIPEYLMIVPHWTLIFLILVAQFYDKEDTFFAIVYAIVFGLLVDIIYTDLLGVYMFVYPLSIYIITLLKRLFQSNLIIASILTI